MKKLAVAMLVGGALFAVGCSKEKADKPAMETPAAGTAAVSETKPVPAEPKTAKILTIDDLKGFWLIDFEATLYTAPDCPEREAALREFRAPHKLRPQERKLLLTDGDKWYAWGGDWSEELPLLRFENNIITFGEEKNNIPFQIKGDRLIEIGHKVTREEMLTAIFRKLSGVELAEWKGKWEAYKAADKEKQAPKTTHQAQPK